MTDKIVYSETYTDDKYDYRIITLPKKICKRMPCPPRLLSKSEWIYLGINQREIWEHYEIFEREPHVLLFRKPKEP